LSIYSGPVAFRMLQGWLDVHSFLARHGIEKAKLDGVESEVKGADGSNASGLLVTIANQLRGALVLPLQKLSLRVFVPNPSPQEAIFGQLKEFSLLRTFELLRTHHNQFSTSKPDYRYQEMDSGNSSSCQSGNRCPDPALTCDATTQRCVLRDVGELPPNHLPQLGPIPAMINTLTSYFMLVSETLERTAAENYGVGDGLNRSSLNALRMYGEAVRLSMVLETYAEDISADDCDAEGVCTPVNWAESLRLANVELAVAQARAFSAARKLANGENPLGIPENDTPLFFGDVTGQSSKYFASSDYLMSGWAVPAVKAAQSSLDEARGAWLAAADRKIQSDQAQEESERRIEGILTTAGERILQNCGPTQVKGSYVAPVDVVDAFTANKIDPGDCAYKPDVPNHVGKPVCPLNISEDDQRNFYLENVTPDQLRNQFCQLDYARQNYPDAFEDAVAPYRNFVINFFSLGTTSYCNDCVTTDCLSKCVQDCEELRKADKLTHRDTSSLNCAYKIDFCNGKLGEFKREVGWSGCFSQHKQSQRYDCEFDTAAIIAATTIKDLSAIHRPFSAHNFGSGPPIELDFPSFDVIERCNATLSTNGMPVQHAGFHSSVQSTVWNNLEIINIGSIPTISAPIAGGTFNAGLLSFFDVLKQKAVGGNDGEYYEAWFEAEEYCNGQGYDAPLPSIEIPLSCFAGTIGDAIGNISQAQGKMRTAKAELDKLTANYEEQLIACDRKLANGNARKVALQKYLTKQKGGWLGSLSKWAPVINTIVTGMTMPGGQFQLANLLRSSSNKRAAGGAAVGILQNLAQDSIDRAEDEYKTVMAELELEDKLDDCRQRARELYRDQKVQASVIREALGIVDSALLSARNRKDENRLTLIAAQGAVNRERQRPVANYSHHMWYDEKIERYHREFEWSKRLTFMAMRAIEYEFQQSLPFRKDIVSAPNPAVLEAVVQALQQEQASRTINRKRPEESSIVLSLRDDVLKVEDRSSAPFGERNWTPAMRLRSRLWSDEYAVRNKDGDWMGQGIPFTLFDEGILETRCGERMWRVTATVQGDGLSPTDPGVPLLLLKQNTFSSKFCNGRGDGETYQVSSIRPSNELFKGGDTGRPQEVSGYSTAMLYPWFNVRRGDFQSSKYVEGASEELAGRGLYGEYILLFPKQILEDKFPLENVEDVLLRIDYHSVDNLAPLSAQPDQTPNGDPLGAMKQFETTKTSIAPSISR
jgi:hypothetical protein